jgi:hypothetical protein
MEFIAIVAQAIGLGNPLSGPSSNVGFGSLSAAPVFCLGSSCI